MICSVIVSGDEGIVTAFDFPFRPCVRTLSLVQYEGNRPAHHGAAPTEKPIAGMHAPRSFPNSYNETRQLVGRGFAMLLTDSGIDQIDSWRSRLLHRFSTLVLGRVIDPDESYQAVWNAGEIQAGPPAAPSLPEPELMRFRSQIHAGSLASDLGRQEQRARVLALRGLSQARDGEYERAQTSFASAARLDPGLDLALLPSFWHLPRRAHEVAIAALRDANRTRDAAALTATVRMRFRPRALRGITHTNDQQTDRNE